MGMSKERYVTPVSGGQLWVGGRCWVFMDAFFGKGHPYLAICTYYSIVYYLSLLLVHDCVYSKSSLKVLRAIPSNTAMSPGLNRKLQVVELLGRRSKYP